MIILTGDDPTYKLVEPIDLGTVSACPHFPIGLFTLFFTLVFPVMVRSIISAQSTSVLRTIRTIPVEYKKIPDMETTFRNSNRFLS